MADEEGFEGGDAGASNTVPVAVSQLKQGGYVIIEGFPCKITHYFTSKPWEQGVGTARITGVDIFTGKIYVTTSPCHMTIDVPLIRKEEYLVGDIVDGQLELLEEGGDASFFIAPPPGTSDVIACALEEREVYATVLSYMGQQKVVG